MKLRKTLALLLTVMMCLSITPVSSFADTPDDGVTLTKTATPVSDRIYNINLGVKGANITNQKPADVTLVFDVSSSMNDSNRLNMTKAAAVSFVNKVMQLNGNASTDIRISLVTFGEIGNAYAFAKNSGSGSTGWKSSVDSSSYNYYTSSSSAAIAAINSVAVPASQNGTGTNTEAGFMAAKAVTDSRSRAGVDSYVIFMTDGVPTLRMENNSFGDSGVPNGYGNYTRNIDFNEAVDKAIALKSGNTIYTVGLLTGYAANSAEMTCANYLLSAANSYTRSYTYDWSPVYSVRGAAYSSGYTKITTSNVAAAAQQIGDAYASLAGTIAALASGTVTDIVPASFTVSESSIRVPAGATYEVFHNRPNDGETKIVVSNIKATADISDITYDVIAKAGYYGSAFTNVSADYDYTLTAGGTGKKEFEKPLVPLAPIAVNDSAASGVNQTITIDVLANDINDNRKLVDAGADSVSSLAITNIVTNSAVTVNIADGKIQFSASATGQYTFTYRAETTVTIKGVETVKTSEPATVTVDVTAPQTYNVSYNANVTDLTTVTNMPSVATGIAAGPYTLSSQVPVRAADDNNTYTFLGWGTEKDATTTVSGITVSDNVTVYAVWETTAIPKFTVSYNANVEDPSTVSEMPAAVSGIVAGVDYTLSKDVQTRAADADYTYSFGGWATSAGSKTPIDKVAITNANVEVFAIWNATEIPKFTVDYDANGTGVSNMPNADLNVKAGDHELSTQVPVRAAAGNSSYVFLGWGKDSGSITTISSINVFDNTTVYAIWKTTAIKEYTVTYVAGTGGTISGSAVQTVFDGGSTAEVTAVPDEGFHFVGWSDENPNAVRSDGKVTKSTTYTAIFAADSGLNITNYTGTYDGKSHHITVNSSDEGTSFLFSTDNELWSETMPEFTNVGSHKVHVKLINDDNQLIELGLGIVDIAARQITILANSKSKQYDGTPLTDSGYTITGGSIVEGQTISGITVNGSQTEVGNSKNAATGGAITGVNQMDVTANYDITFADGTLTVTSAGGTGGGGGGGTGGGGGGGGGTTITDEEVPLGPLNMVDHYAYIQGYPDITVRPQGNVTREEVAAVFFRLLDPTYKETIRSTTENFGDVDANRWSEKHIATLANGEIINGYEDGSFRPGAYITRAELAAIASRFDALSTSSAISFSDISNSWAKDYIVSAAAKGWVNGYEDGTFKPNQYITRAEFVTLVNNVLERQVSEDKILPGVKEFSDLEKGKWYYCDMQEALNSHKYEKDTNGNETWTELYTAEIEM